MEREKEIERQRVVFLLTSGLNIWPDFEEPDSDEKSDKEDSQR